jgi:hypothetical protein
LAEVDEDETIQRIGKMRIDVEAQQFPAEFQILFEENGNALTVCFHVGDDKGQGVEVAKEMADGDVVGGGLVAPEGTPGFYELGKILIGFLVL